MKKRSCESVPLTTTERQQGKRETCPVSSKKNGVSVYLYVISSWNKIITIELTLEGDGDQDTRCSRPVFPVPRRRFFRLKITLNS